MATARIIARVRNMLLVGAIALAPTVGTIAAAPSAAAADEVAVIDIADYDQDGDGYMDVVPLGGLSITAEGEGSSDTTTDELGVVRDADGNVIDRSSLARVGTDVDPEYDQDGDGYMDIVPIDGNVDLDNVGDVTPISAPVHRDMSWIPGLIGGLALGSLGTWAALRNRLRSVGTIAERAVGI